MYEFTLAKWLGLLENFRTWRIEVPAPDLIELLVAESRSRSIVQFILLLVQAIFHINVPDQIIIWIQYETLIKNKSVSLFLV